MGDGTEKNIDALLSLASLQERYGCAGKNADWRDWVFPRIGVKGEVDFDKSFFEIVKAKGLAMPVDPHPGLYYRRGVEEVARSGDEAERKFFSSFAFLGDFFSHPSNAPRLGMLLRQFMSRYCGEGILKGLPKEVSAGLRRAEDAVISTCGGSHAFATDTLRILYNSSMVKLVSSGAGKDAGAVYLGEGGRKLTPIGAPESLLDRMDHDEREQRGRIFCIDARTGNCYERGGWTESEWVEALARVEAESGGSADAKRSRTRALDSRYFPEKITPAIGLRYNILSELSEEAIVHCRQNTIFQISRLGAKLSDGRGSKEHEGEPDSSYFEVVDSQEEDGMRFLTAPGSREEMIPDEAGLEGIETAEARGESKPAEQKAPEAKGGKTVRKGETGDIDKRVKKFIKEKGLKNSDTVYPKLEKILGQGGFTGADFSEESASFSKAVVAISQEGDAREWRKSAGAALSKEDALHLWKGHCRRGGRTAIALAGDEGVYLVGKKAGRPEVLFVKADTFDHGAEVKRGKLYYGGRSYLAAQSILRVPFGEGAKAAGQGLSRGGKPNLKTSIFNSLRKVFRGGI
jgi:hypothetical protein